MIFNPEKCTTAATETWLKSDCGNILVHENLKKSLVIQNVKLIECKIRHGSLYWRRSKGGLNPESWTFQCEFDALMALHSTSSRVTKMRNGNLTVMLCGEDIFENVSHHGFAKS